MLTDATLTEALEVIGDLLADRGERCEAVIIGGGALLLLGVVERPTKDLDVVALVDDGGRWICAKPFPPALDTAIADVASALGLPVNWLNPGPTSMLEFGLPDGCQQRAQTRVFGSFTIHIASEYDHVAFKLYAAADHWPDQSRHLQDLKRLQPTTEQLRAAASWCRSHDPSIGFRDGQLIPVLREFGLGASDAD